MATIYPADISPTPDFAAGVIKLASAYTGNAMAVYNQTTSGGPRDISFVGDDLNEADLDNLLSGPSIGVVTTLYDQIGSSNLVQSDNTKAPTITTDPIANARAIMFRGGSNSGALTGWTVSSISSWGVTAQVYTVILVVQPSSSLFVNQAGAPGVSTGALFDFQGTGGTVARLYNDSNSGVIGGWRITDDAAFSFLGDAAVQCNPIVLTVISDGTTVTVYQNEDARSTSSVSALTRTATSLYVGWLSSSSAGANSNCWDGGFGAMMVYGEALSAQKAAYVRNALYERFSINPHTSRLSSNYGVFLIGDSIPAGYSPSIPVFNGTDVGLYGMLSYLQPLLDAPAKCLNYSNPGSTVTQNGVGAVYTYNAGLLPIAIVPQLAQPKGGSVVIILAGGNDFTITPTPPSAATVFAGIQSMVSAASAVVGTTVIVCPVLPRDVSYQSDIDALNVLIRAGAGYTLADWAGTDLENNPGSCYADATHLSAIGHETFAEFIAPYVNAVM